MSDPTPLLHELDLCACGDYRRDHEGGTGRCRMADDLSHGFRPCFSFRLATPHRRSSDELSIGDRVPMPPKPKLKVYPSRNADSSTKGPRGAFTNGRGKAR